MLVIVGAHATVVVTDEVVEEEELVVEVDADVVEELAVEVDADVVEEPAVEVDGLEVVEVELIVIPPAFASIS